MKKDIFDLMGEGWKSPVVARTKIEEFSGGLIKPKSMANLDSQGVGPDRVKIGRKTGYPISGENGLVSWLRTRASK